MANLDITMDNTVAVMAWNHEQENGFTTGFCGEIIDALDALANEAEVTGVVITGSQEKYFSTGLDLEWVKTTCKGDMDLLMEFFSAIIGMSLKLTTFPKPLVAAINGHAAAMGCISAAYMDYRLMRDDFGYVLIPEVKINIPFTPSMIAIFNEILPGSSFRDMAYTGNRFTPKEAKALGYIDRLCPKDTLISEAVELAGQLGEVNLETYATIKIANRKRVIDAIKNEDPAFIERLCRKLASNTGNLD
ncbi:MAG: enoyl-CoA hydratase/isomerase family protein [Desulfobacterium sp.]